MISPDDDVKMYLRRGSLDQSYCKLFDSSIIEKERHQPFHRLRINDMNVCVFLCGIESSSAFHSRFWLVSFRLTHEGLEMNTVPYRGSYPSAP